MSRQQSRKSLIGALSLANMGANLCIAVVPPFFPQEAELKGLTPTFYALIFAIFSICRLLSSTVWARVVSRNLISCRFLFLSSLFATGYSTLLIGILQFGPGGWKFFACMAALRVTTAISTAAFNICLYTIIQQIFQRKASTAFGTIEIASSVAYVGGLPTAGALYKIGGFYVPFIIVGFLVTMSTFVVSCVIPEYEAPEREKQGFRQFLRVPAVIIGLSFVSATRYSYTFITTLLEIELLQLGAGYIVVGMIFSLNKLCYMIFVILVGVTLDKWMACIRYVLMLGFTVKFVSFLLWTAPDYLPIKQDLRQVGILVGLSGVGDAMLLNGSFSLMKRVAVLHGFPESMKTYSILGSCYNMAVYCGSFWGAATSGVMEDQLGLTTSSLIIAGSFALLAVLCPGYVTSALKKPRIRIPTRPEGVQTEEKKPLLKEPPVQMEQED